VYGPFLVVVPLSTVPNWIKELRKWIPRVNAIVYVGDTKSREVSVGGAGGWSTVAWLRASRARARRRRGARCHEALSRASLPASGSALAPRAAHPLPPPGSTTPANHTR